jgi:hypothetical protein
MPAQLTVQVLKVEGKPHTIFFTGYDEIKAYLVPIGDNGAFWNLEVDEIMGFNDEVYRCLQEKGSIVLWTDEDGTEPYYLHKTESADQPVTVTLEWVEVTARTSIDP